MFINGDSGHHKTARVYTNEDVNQGACVEVYFNLYGNDDQKLNVYCGRLDGDSLVLDESPLKTLTGNYGESWVQGTIDVVPQFGTKCKVMYEVRGGGGGVGRIERNINLYPINKNLGYI